MTWSRWPPPTSRKFAGSPRGLDQVHRAHRQPALTRQPMFPRARHSSGPFRSPGLRRGLLRDVSGGQFGEQGVSSRSSWRRGNSPPSAVTTRIDLHEAAIVAGEHPASIAQIRGGSQPGRTGQVSGQLADLVGHQAGIGSNGSRKSARDSRRRPSRYHAAWLMQSRRAWPRRI